MTDEIAVDKIIAHILDMPPKKFVTLTTEQAAALIARIPAKPKPDITDRLREIVNASVWRGDLPESVTPRDLRLMCNDAVTEIRTLRATLKAAGYTHTPGAAMWKPPIGKLPSFSAANRPGGNLTPDEIADIERD